MNPNNQDGGEDNTGFGRGIPVAAYYGGWNPGMRPMYPYVHGPWTAAMNQGFMPIPIDGAFSAAPNAIPEVAPSSADSGHPYAIKESTQDVEVQIIGTSQPCKGTGSRQGTRGKGPNFSPTEEVLLTKTWLAVSCDPIVNTGQKKEGLWARIDTQYNNNRGSFPERSIRSLQSKWEDIHKRSSKFAGFMAHVLRQPPSGTTDANQTSLALNNYAEVEGTTFDYVHWWDLLKDEPRWMALVTKGPGGGVEDPIEEHVPSAATPSSQNTGSRRPVGRDAARKSAKKASSSSPSESSQYAEKMHGLAIHRFNVWQEETEKRGSRYEAMAALEAQRFQEVATHNQQLVAHNEKMAQIEAAKLTLLQQKAEMDRTHEEERILAIDLDTCRPNLREYYEARQLDILRRVKLAKDQEGVDP